MTQPDSVAGVAVTSAPGLFYIFYHTIIDAPIEKWVSTITFVFIVLQIVFLVIDRLKRRRSRK